MGKWDKFHDASININILDNWQIFITTWVFTCIVLVAIIPVCNNIVHTKLITKLWEYGDIAKENSDGARNISQTIRQVFNKPSG